jgi:hypothetical protein
MRKIRDIIGMCHLIEGLEYNSGIVTEFGREIFKGSVWGCHAYVSLFQRKAKAEQLYNLLEKICRSNIEQLRKDSGGTGILNSLNNMIAELEEVYLSDDEVNEREMRR